MIKFLSADCVNEVLMKSLLQFCCAAVVLLFALANFARAQTQTAGLTPAQMNAKAKAQNVPEIPFDSAPNFLKLPPNLYLGESIGVASNSQRHAFVYTPSQQTHPGGHDHTGHLGHPVAHSDTDV